MKQSSLIFIGSADFGKVSLDRIVIEGHAVTGVITEVNDPCAQYAKKKGIPTIQLAERHRKIDGSLKEKVMKFINRREPDFLAMCVWEKQMPPELVKQYAEANPDELEKMGVEIVEGNDGNVSLEETSSDEEE